MPGLISFLNKNTLDSYDFPSFSEVAGETCTNVSDEYIQLLIKNIEKGIGIEVYSVKGLSLYIYGDIYSIDDEMFAGKGAAETIVDCFLADKLEEIACKINGYFIGVIVDSNSHKLTIFNDRYGIKPLYLWLENNAILGVASEIKSLVLHPNYNVSVDKEALHTFLGVGHFLSQQTMFSNVKRMSPATILTIDVKSGIVEETMYWKWGDIAANKDISFEQAVERSYELFDQAMKRQLAVVNEPKVAITLSGGLDSRVLLAAAKEHFEGKIDTFTFGSQGCEDAIIAAQVAELSGVKNTFVEVNQQNWYQGRDSGVWLTDGMKNILHMHALSSVKEISKSSHYLLNGFLGDVTFGGSYLFDSSYSQLNLEEKTKAKYQAYAKNAGLSSSYYDAPFHEPLFIYNRGVRFISAGSDLLGAKLHNLKPFFDNQLVEFLYSLPENYRKNGKLYHHMLLKYYPDYFKDIPWQQTGKPISTNAVKKDSARKSFLIQLKQRVIDWVKGSPFDSVLRAIYRKLVKPTHYVTYDDWLRRDEFKHYVFSLLNSTDSHVHKIYSEVVVNKHLNDYYNGKGNNRPEVIGSLLTIELYFQKLSKFGKHLK